MMIVPRCSSVFRITPCQIRKPPSVTTNDGTPTNATIDPWMRADRGADGDRDHHREQAVDLVAAARKLQLRHDERADAGEVADREVDLAEQQHEDDAEREHRRAGALGDQVVEVDGGEEVRRREAEEDDDDDHRRR